MMRASWQGYFGVNTEIVPLRAEYLLVERLMISQMILSITAKEDEILKAIEENQVVVVVGETGSGKTTQLPLFLYRAGYDNADQKIGVTQPRRIAATSVARFVAQSLNVELGEEVGYKIRFDDATSEGTAIKFMTDGILLREAQIDPDLSQYSVIVVDEAHERSLNIDFVLGLLKDVLPRRPDLKVVVMSATIDPKKFADYFDGAPVIMVSGRTYPVEIMYKTRSYPYGMDGADVIDAVVEQVSTICSHGGTDGDVLVFMTGKDDIDAAVKGIREKLGDQNNHVAILPVYGAMMPEEQQKIFGHYPGKRKVILATNIAETSLTIDGIVYVVDTGYIKQTSYDSSAGVASLDVVQHSRAGCDQRAGRAGRTRPGICIRLYTEMDYLSRLQFTEPEILRTDLAGVVLQMIAMGLKNVEKFDFIDPPDREAFHDAHEALRALGALNENDQLTKIGQTMASLPLAPRIGRMLIAARDKGCVMEVSIIAASLGQRSPFVMPQEQEKRWDAQRAHSEFRDPRSDFQSLLSVYRAYHLGGARRDWCKERFIDWRVMEEVTKVEKQITDVLRHHGFQPSSSTSQSNITLAVASGLAQNLCEKVGRYNYMRDGALEDVYVHPGSGLFNGGAGRFMVCVELFTTKKCYARGCVVIEPVWLPEIVPHLCRIVTKGLVRWDSERSVAVLEETIFYKECEVGTRERMLPLREAHAFQEGQVAEALKKGYQKLTVINGQYSFDRVAVGLDKTRYRVSLTFDSIELGEYYCQIDGELDDWYTSSYGVRGRAIPKVRVIDLPPLPVEKVERKEEAKPKESVDLSSLRALKDRFNQSRVIKQQKTSW